MYPIMLYFLLTFGLRNARIFLVTESTTLTRLLPPPENFSSLEVPRHCKCALPHLGLAQDKVQLKKLPLNIQRVRRRGRTDMSPV